MGWRKGIEEEFPVRNKDESKNPAGGWAPVDYDAVSAESLCHVGKIWTHLSQTYLKRSNPPISVICNKITQDAVLSVKKSNVVFSANLAFKVVVSCNLLI